MSGVKVAVRVRPFNSRENTMNAKCCLEMEGKMTVIVDPETQKDKKFTFDFSYWSHDCFREGDDGELIATNPKYATQRAVYDDIGADVLNNAFGGYNSTLFAYGQTGAGKSFSMVGYGVNKGIIPIGCNERFKQVTLRVRRRANSECVDLHPFICINECIVVEMWLDMSCV
jgi:kinesin family protein 1